MNYISRAQFKDAPTGSALRKDLFAAPTDLGNRQIRFVISTSNVDRSGDVIDQSGWDLDHYRRNPVVLWGHDADALPIGRAVDIGVEDGDLVATVEFIPASVPIAGEMAEAVYQLCKSGFLSATSVGFIPVEFSETDDKARGGGTYSAGLDFARSELLEFSVVTIPNNRQSLIAPGQQDAALAPEPEPAKSAKGEIAKARRRREMDLLARR